MEGRSTLSLTLVAFAALLGCGGSSAPPAESEVRAVAARYDAAIDSGDGAEVCSLLTPASVAMSEHVPITRGSIDRTEQAIKPGGRPLGAAISAIASRSKHVPCAESPGLAKWRVGEIDSVSVQGDVAMVTPVAGTPRDAYDTYLRGLDGQWMVDLVKTVSVRFHGLFAAD